MVGTKPCDGGMIRNRLSLQQVHKVDVPSAGGFDPAREDMVHVRIDKDGEHLPGVSPEIFQGGNRFDIGRTSPFLR